MENLTEKVYESSLAIEAHMICDLLARAGISARVEGEFLQTGGGELPLGNLVKVRVDPARAAEAREVIADWEKSQPADTPPDTRPPRLKSPLWFLMGGIVGAILVYVPLTLRASHSIIDYDGDGRADVRYTFVGSQISKTEIDRNLDGKPDGRWTFDASGFEEHHESDEDFDGHFEWQEEMANGSAVLGVLDADRDGRPEKVSHFRNGVVQSVDFYFASGGRIVKRQFFKSGTLESAEFDDDGDGVFERRVRYDAHEEPVL